jgi:hypothetical protein
MARRPRGCDATTESPRHRPNAGDAPSTPTTVGEQLAWATRVLTTVGAPEPAREAAMLLASVMGVPIAPRELDPAVPLAASQVDRFLAAIARRTRDEPQRP